MVDTSQYQVRIDDFDYDLLAVSLNFFPPPGPSSAAISLGRRHRSGSANIPGIKDPVVDALIEELIAAKDLPTLAATNRALDRVLLWGWYQIPQWYNDESLAGVLEQVRLPGEEGPVCNRLSDYVVVERGQAGIPVAAWVWQA